jgi:hypothetical protein
MATAARVPSVTTRTSHQVEIFSDCCIRLAGRLVIVLENKVPAGLVIGMAATHSFRGVIVAGAQAN